MLGRSIQSPPLLQRLQLSSMRAPHGGSWPLSEAVHSLQGDCNCIACRHQLDAVARGSSLLLTRAGMNHCSALSTVTASDAPGFLHRLTHSISTHTGTSLRRPSDTRRSQQYRPTRLTRIRRATQDSCCLPPQLLGSEGIRWSSDKSRSVSNSVGEAQRLFPLQPPLSRLDSTCDARRSSGSGCHPNSDRIC